MAAISFQKELESILDEWSEGLWRDVTLSEHDSDYLGILLTLKIKLLNGVISEDQYEAYIRQLDDSDNDEIGYRVCDICQKPMLRGYTNLDGGYHCCEDCFHRDMDETYGKGRWLPIEDQNHDGGNYKYLDKKSNVWVDTGIYWTEWDEES